ncbi:MAG: stage III sporulation protein AC [Ruminococcaceae bacterium]|nr:stage III sporulation protein AC [Oscillospiraceae bacterium]
MDIGLILKVAGIGLTVSIAYQLLAKYGRDEQAVLVSLAGIILILLMLTDKLGTLFANVRTIFGL